MISEYNIKGYVSTHHMQRKRMMKTRLAPEKGWGIWIGQFCVTALLFPDRGHRDAFTSRFARRQSLGGRLVPWLCQYVKRGAAA